MAIFDDWCETDELSERRKHYYKLTEREDGRAEIIERLPELAPGQLVERLGLQDDLRINDEYPVVGRDVQNGGHVDIMPPAEESGN